jgi:hypothetical protein
VAWSNHVSRLPNYEAPAHGDRVELRGFGAFTTKRRAARTGRNQATGEAVSVDAKLQPSFRASRGLLGAPHSQRLRHDGCIGQAAEAELLPALKACRAVRCGASCCGNDAAPSIRSGLLGQRPGGPEAR